MRRLVLLAGAFVATMSPATAAVDPGTHLTGEIVLPAGCAISAGAFCPSAAVQIRSIPATWEKSHDADVCFAANEFSEGAFDVTTCSVQDGFENPGTVAATVTAGTCDEAQIEWAGPDAGHRLLLWFATGNVYRLDEGQIHLSGGREVASTMVWNAGIVLHGFFEFAGVTHETTFSFAALAVASGTCDAGFGDLRLISTTS